MVKMNYKDIKTRVVKNQENDPRRNKKKCIYYDDGYCNNKHMDCYASSYCFEYCEQRKISRSKIILEENDLNNKPKINDNADKKHVVKVKDCHSVINVTIEKHNKMEDMVNKGKKQIIDLFLNGASWFFLFDKYNVGSIYFNVERKIIRCGYDLQKLEIFRSDDIITVHFPISRFHKNTDYNNIKYKNIWRSNDPLYGDVFFKIKEIPPKKSNQNYAG